METGGEGGFYFWAIDNDKRRQDLAIVEAASNIDELLLACQTYFDTEITSLTAQQVLDQFRDEELSPLLARTEGFDPTLYKACILFELTHLKLDDSEIPFMLENLTKFWKTANDIDEETAILVFTAPTKRSNYTPFASIARRVTDTLVHYEVDKHMEQMKNESESKTGPEPDELSKEIDGDTRKWRIFAGRQELKRDMEHPVLTLQLKRDLRRLYPEAIVMELDFRFPDTGTVEDIYPLIETIQYEREQGILPSAEDIVSGYRRFNRKMRGMFGSRWEIEDKEGEDELKAALSDLVRHHRNISNRIHHRDVYSIETGQWFVVHQLVSDIELDKCYRRIFCGDTSILIEDLEEIPVEEREIAIAALRKDRLRFAKNEHPYDHWDNPNIQDVFGPFEESVPEEASRKAYPKLQE